jgi:hypothetical protein
MIEKTASVTAIIKFQTLNKILETQPCGIAVTLTLAFEDTWLESHLLYQLF